ncbi:helix-turn-helix domain-containing protein [Amycolatopsis sp. NPDC047767]|uniref:TetR/AcrR family transcriptional regulator n=1 Tax=Amycolatopsis sp. NPDC047767 TaxID=3156765 RepID=UPI00345385F1
MTNTGRSLRADAQENQDRILDAAARAFSLQGADTSLKSIAKEAGVGIATLYRRFPAREDLVEATYRSETERLAGSAADLLAELPADAALRAWAERFVDYTLTKNGMAEALPGILAAREGLRTHSRDLLRAAIGRMLAAAAEAGTLRADVPADDVMMAIGGVTLIAGHEDQRELASRLLDLVVAGLRPH